MAPNTSPDILQMIIYEVYVRNHGPNGTFDDVTADLPRLKALGVDMVWFMPIHSIGQLNKKGGLGCPYSCRDYRDVNPEYGTLDDFALLIQRAHELGMKVMIDVVYNHTGHDFTLVKTHPEFFHQDSQGRPFTTVPDWSDVIDLKHPHPDLTRYLVDSLVGWAKFGIDGFRCDVASLLPLDFWLQARREVEQARPGVIWLAESVHASFIESRRARGLSGISDGELYNAFDICYDYEIWGVFQQAVLGKLPLRRYLELLRFQEAIYPGNYAKMRCVENHDNARIMRLAPSQPQALAWTAFQAFNKGPFLIYAGQESAATHTPTLFDIDKVEWKDYPLQEYLTRLAHLKKDRAQVEGRFVISAAEPVIQAGWEHPQESLFGVFNPNAVKGTLTVPLPDGDYTDLLNGGVLAVRGGSITVPASAAIVRCGPALGLQAFQSELLDFHLQLSE